MPVNLNMAEFDDLTLLVPELQEVLARSHVPLTEEEREWMFSRFATKWRGEQCLAPQASRAVDAKALLAFMMGALDPWNPGQGLEAALRRALTARDAMVGALGITEKF